MRPVEGANPLVPRGVAAVQHVRRSGSLSLWGVAVCGLQLSFSYQTHLKVFHQTITSRLSFKNLTKALLFVFNVPQGPPLTASQRPGFPRPFSINAPQSTRWRSKLEFLHIGLRDTIPRNHLKNHLKHPQGPPLVASQRPGFPRPFSIDTPQPARWRSKPNSFALD